jgi:hypothetical protein
MLRVEISGAFQTMAINPSRKFTRGCFVWVITDRVMLPSQDPRRLILFRADDQTSRSSQLPIFTIPAAGQHCRGKGRQKVDRSIMMVIKSIRDE